MLLIQGPKGIKSERSRSNLTYKSGTFSNKSKMDVKVLLTNFGVCLFVWVLDFIFKENKLLLLPVCHDSHDHRSSVADVQKYT